MATYLTEEQKKKVIERINNDIKNADKARQQEQQEATQKFNEAIQERGTVDKNRHTFTIGDLSKNSPRIAANILNPNKTIGGTIFNSIGKFGYEVGKTAENIGLGMINGIKDFKKSFNINTQDPLVLNKLITQSVSEKIKENNPLGSILLNGISNSNPQYVDEKLEKRKENIEKLQEEKNENTKKILDNTEKISNPVMKKVSELAPSVGQMIPMYVPVLGTAYALGSAQGAYYDEAKQRGMNEADAITFSGLMGIFEGLTDMIGVSKIKKGGKVIGSLIKGTGKEVAKEGVETLGKAGIKEALKQYGIGIADNVIQEAIIEPIQESVATLTGGADKAEWENMGQRMLQSGIDGGLVAAIMGGANAGGNACISLIQKVNSGQTPTIQEVQKAIKEANESEKIDVENLIIESTQQQINKISNENNIANNSQENVQQNATNSQFMQDSQQITPLQQENAQNGASSQIQENGQNISEEINQDNNNDNTLKINENFKEKQNKPNIINQKVENYIKQVKDQFTTDINVDTKVISQTDIAPINYRNAKEVVVKNKAQKLFEKIKRNVFKNGNEDIYVDKSDIKESIHHTLKDNTQKTLLNENLAIYSQLDKIIEKGKQISEEDELKGRSQFKNWKYYASNVTIDGNPYVVEFDTTIKNGERHFRIERLYNIKEVDIATDSSNNNLRPRFECNIYF